MLQGPELESSRSVSAASGLPVLFSGGVSSGNDLSAIDATGDAAGAIVGTAIYERHVNLRNAIITLQRSEDMAGWVAW